MGDVISLFVPGATPIADRGIGAAMMHVILARRTAERQLLNFLGHCNLIDIGRVTRGNRSQRFRFGGRGRTLLHT